MLSPAGPVEEFARSLTERDGKPAAYLCTGTTCQAPITDPEQLKETIRTGACATG